MNTKHPEWVFLEIDDTVHESSPVSYDLSLFAQVIENLRPANAHEHKKTTRYSKEEAIVNAASHLY